MPQAATQTADFDVAPDHLEATLNYIIDDIIQRSLDLVRRDVERCGLGCSLRHGETPLVTSI